MNLVGSNEQFEHIDPPNYDTYPLAPARWLGAWPQAGIERDWETPYSIDITLPDIVWDTLGKQ